jgi:NADH-quinone oxidoreductase subunit M
VTTVPWLTLLWALPVIGALIIIVLPAAQRQTAKYAGLAVSLAVLAVTAVVAVRFDPAGSRYQFVESHTWISYFGTGYILGVDGIALALVVLTAVLMPLLLIAGWNDIDDKSGISGRAPQAYVALMLAVEGMVLMSFMALDILLFYIFFEAMLIPMYFLIGGFGSRNPASGKAAVKFLLYNLFGGLVMLAALIGLYVATSQADVFDGGTFDFRRIADAVSAGTFVIPPAVANALFGGFMFAFAVKAPLWPLHRWLPDAAVQATPASAVLMMAVMDKVGTFGMLR